MDYSFRVSAGGTALWYGWFEAMHTRMDLLLTGLPEPEALAAAEAVRAETVRLESRFNRFDRRSDLWRINRTSGSGPIPLDGEWLSVFDEAERCRQLTGGWFDIAVRTPDHSRGGETYRVDSDRRELVRLREGLVFDFGGYAKGYALERAERIVRRAGVENGMISFGNSSVCCLGRHPAGECWRVGVENPLDRRPLVFFDLRDAALSSSGNNGRNDGHILAVGEGRGVTRPAIVSVAAPSPLACEVLSTALFASLDGADDGERRRMLAAVGAQRPVRMDYGSGEEVCELLTKE